MTSAAQQQQDTDHYPVWSKDGTSIDPEWLTSKTTILDRFLNNSNTHCDLRIESCRVVADKSNASRQSQSGSPKDGATVQLVVTFSTSVANDDDGGEPPLQPLSLILKQVPQNSVASLQLSQQLGLAREGLFYKHFLNEPIGHSSIHANVAGNTAMTVADIVPRIYYSYGNYNSGEKIVLMDDLSTEYVDSAIYFGPGNPNNWNRDLPTLIRQASEAAASSSSNGVVPSADDITKETFIMIAKIHGHFWKRPDLLLSDDKTWLRGYAWIQGQGQESWEASQNLIRGIWQNTAPQEMNTRIQWDPLLKSITERAIQGISWEAQLQRLNPKDPISHWTLVHGDFWPGNVMWRNAQKQPHQQLQTQQLLFLDWEMCGIGSGPQDLGQYVISNLEPSIRRQHEHELVRAYYDELCASISTTNQDVGTFEECWKEYTIGGLERWIWFLVWFLGQHDNANLKGWAQFFHDQMSSFVHDHNITPDDITQPRP